MFDFKNKGKIGFTCSAFDLLHAGHIVMLEESKRNCDYLIVGLQVDASVDGRTGKHPPVQSIVERQIQIEAVEFVDAVFVYETEADLENLLRVLPIDVRFIGKEYMNKDFTGKHICENLGIEIFYNRERYHNFSSSKLTERAFENEITRRKNTVKDSDGW